MVLNLLVRPGFKVEAYSSETGCRFAGKAAAAPSPGASGSVTLDLAATNCRSVAYNRRYAGTAVLPDGGRIANLTLKAAQAGYGYEVFGPLQKVGPAR